MDSQTHATDSQTHAMDSETHAMDSQTHAMDSQTYAMDSQTYAMDSQTYAMIAKHMLRVDSLCKRVLCTTEWVERTSHICCCRDDVTICVNGHALYSSGPISKAVESVICNT